MARYTGPSCKLCRREGTKLYLKGDRCYTDKCAIARRAYAPGQHGQSRKKLGNYGMQLREKQKCKRIYGLLEAQFRKTYDEADRLKGKTGENLLILLEQRMDNVVYRLGFAGSRPEARQLVRHGHFTVNGQKVNIPSYEVKSGDVVALKNKSRQSDKFKAIAEVATTNVPKWLTVDKDKMEGQVVALPQREDIDIPVNETLIVELYSR
jgi:small subunit ribosomal protein S4